MEDDLTQIKMHLQKKRTWIRASFMLLFAFILYSLVYTPFKYAFFALIVFQLGSMLLTGELNEHLLSFSKSLCAYIYQILCFLTYSSDKKPFPLGELPASELLVKREPAPLHDKNTSD